MKIINYLCFSAVACALLFLVYGCVDNLRSDQEEQISGQETTFVLTVNATKDLATKALNHDDLSNILSTWAADEKVTVFNKTKGAALTGYLTPTSAGAATASLSGVLKGAISVNDELTLSYGSNDYAGQDGTLNYENRATSISRKCNYALATVTVTQINGIDVTTGSASFVNQQAIFDFWFYDEMGNLINTPESVTLRYGNSGVISLTGLTLENTYAPNSSQSGYLYIAIPGITNEKLSIEITKSGKTYYFENNNATITNGKFYKVTVFMYNDLTSPFTFEAIKNGTTISMNKYGSISDRPVQYRINRGAWTNYDNNNKPSINKGDRIQFLGSNTSYATGDNDYYSFAPSDSCFVYGNIMSLVNGSSFASDDLTLEAKYTFSKLFKGTKIKSHETKALALPATTLNSSCYEKMFYDCSGLSKAPNLPATQMKIGCYGYMFHGTGLKSIPALPATNLAERCYEYMFSNCKGLTTIPLNLLPATTLIKKCYAFMFDDCSGLETIPQNLLPAAKMAASCYEGMFQNCTGLSAIPSNLLQNVTILDEVCYRYMFKGCTGLSSIPDDLLHVTTLKWLCYSHMFSGCKGLTTLPAALLPASTLAEDCYQNMFDGCTGLNTIPTGFLDHGTTLAESCYEYMFKNCSNLKTLPSNLLPTTNLQPACYLGMFQGCSSLTTAPALPASTLKNYCYKYMFFDCSSLTTAPTLSAESLADQCYFDMFRNCSSLQTPPALPATNLKDNCYRRMFQGCTSLTTAPVLKATTLETHCYEEMFKGCEKLASVTCLATSISATDCTKDWLSGVATNGTFTKASSMNNWGEGVNGIPSNWTVSDYVTQ